MIASHRDEWGSYVDASAVGQEQSERSAREFASDSCGVDQLELPWLHHKRHDGRLGGIQRHFSECEQPFARDGGIPLDCRRGDHVQLNRLGASPMADVAHTHRKLPCGAALAIVGEDANAVDATTPLLCNRDVYESEMKRGVAETEPKRKQRSTLVVAIPAEVCARTSVTVWPCWKQKRSAPYTRAVQQLYEEHKCAGKKKKKSFETNH